LKRRPHPRTRRAPRRGRSTQALLPADSLRARSCCGGSQKNGRNACGGAKQASYAAARSHMKHPSSSRVYRFLLKLFPFDFQREYGGEMEGLFQQQLRDTPRGRLWWRTAFGFVKTAPVEHLDLFRRDVRHGVRSLAQNRIVTLIAITTL